LKEGVEFFYLLVDNNGSPEMKIVFSEKCLNYSQPGHPESPERVRSSRKLLAEEGYEFVEPLPCTEDDIPQGSLKR
jgi:hypothetical protein